MKQLHILIIILASSSCTPLAKMIIGYKKPTVIKQSGDNKLGRAL